MLLGDCIFYLFGNDYYSKTPLFIQYVLSDTILDAGDMAVSKIVKNFCHCRTYILVGAKAKNPKHTRSGRREIIGVIEKNKIGKES